MRSKVRRVGGGNFRSPKGIGLKKRGPPKRARPRKKWPGWKLRCNRIGWIVELNQDRQDGWIVWGFVFVFDGPVFFVFSKIVSFKQETIPNFLISDKMKDALCTVDIFMLYLLYAPCEVMCLTKICPDDVFGDDFKSTKASPSPAPNLQSYCMVLYACAEAWNCMSGRS